MRRSWGQPNMRAQRDSLIASALRSPLTRYPLYCYLNLWGGFNDG
jgi:hypothetical protein